MSTHSIAEAQENLPDLIVRASKGEAVAITDGEKVVATLNAVAQLPEGFKGTVDEALDWLASRRATRPSLLQDAGTLVSQMRDEEWTR